MTSLLKIGLLLFALAVFVGLLVDKPAPATALVNSNRPPELILKVKAGNRLIEVSGRPEKGAYVFQPYIERDDDALLTVLRTVVENQTGQPVAHQEYVNNESPPWLVIGRARPSVQGDDFQEQ
jgi:hypothetical protein